MTDEPRLETPSEALKRLEACKAEKRAKQFPLFTKEKAAYVARLRELRKREILQSVYHQQELDKREPGGWQAKVFEDALKRNNEQIDEYLDLINKGLALKPGQKVPPLPADYERLFGLPKPLSDALWGLMMITGVLMTGGWLFSACSSMGPNDTFLEMSCINEIKKGLKDPGSFKYKSGTKDDDSVTITYRAKNSFGAYVIGSYTCSR